MSKKAIKGCSIIKINDVNLISQEYEIGSYFLVFLGLDKDCFFLKEIFKNDWKKVPNITVEQKHENGETVRFSLFECEVLLEIFGRGIKVKYKTKVSDLYIDELLCNKIIVRCDNKTGYISEKNEIDEKELEQAQYKRQTTQSIKEQILAYNDVIKVQYPLIPFTYKDGEFEVKLTFRHSRVEILISNNKVVPYDEYQHIYLRLIELLNIIIGETLNINQILFDGKYLLNRKLLWRYDYVPYMSPDKGSLVNLSELTNLQEIYDTYKALVDNNKNKLTFDLFYAGQNEKGYSEMQLVHILQALEGFYNIKPLKIKKTRLSNETKIAIHNSIKNLEIPEITTPLISYLDNCLNNFGNTIFKDKIKSEIMDYGQEIFNCEIEQNKFDVLIEDFATLRDRFSHGYYLRDNKTVQIAGSDFTFYSLMLILLLKLKLIEMLGLNKNKVAIQSYIDEMRKMFGKM